MKSLCLAPALLLMALTACGAADTLTSDPPFDAAAYMDASSTNTDGSLGKDGSLPGEDAEAQQEAAPPPEAGLPDTGIPTTKACKNAGGVLCTDARWLLCPAGFEPVGQADGHFNCGKTNDGWCCQPAPPSSCSESGTANCVPGSCTGCFGPAPDESLTCEADRACCIDICD